MKNKPFLYLLLLSFLIGSCTKGYLDINKDPNNPTSVASSLLLTQSEMAIANSLGYGYDAQADQIITGAGSILSVYTHQETQYSSFNKYGATGSDVSSMWRGIYVRGLENLATLINQAKADGDMQYVGIATVLQAFTFSQMVDMFGDIPFSEAIRFKESDITNPKFDKGEDIYPQLFKMLDTAILYLQDNSAVNEHIPGDDDLIYGGNMDLWVKTANTIKLKLYNQIRLVQDVSSQVTDLVNNQPLISSTEESFVFPYGSKNAPDERNPGFSEYFATQKTQDVSPWFYGILKGYNSNIFKGIEDPRIPYYIYNQLSPTGADREGNATEYRDGGFVSLIFGSDGPNYGAAQDASQSVLGIYPVGGRYDDGGAEAVDASSGTGAAPFRMITFADVLYMEAELIKVGDLPGGEAAARNKFQKALEESIKQVDYFVSAVGSGQSIPELAGSTAANDYISAIMDYYDNHSSQQLQIIITEKWIAAFGGDYVNLYNDYRRTGFPIMFDPNNSNMAPGGKVQPPVHGNPAQDPQAPVPVSISKKYPVTLPWSSSELDANRNAPSQKDPSSFKVFWIP